MAAVEMPRVGPVLIVPCELEGERILAMVATGSGEVILDSTFVARFSPKFLKMASRGELGGVLLKDGREGIRHGKADTVRTSKVEAKMDENPMAAQRSNFRREDLMV